MERLAFNRGRLDEFWRFIAERQSVWHRRFVLEELPPWTSDKVISSFRFTNAYRILDPGTEYAVHAIIGTDAPKADKAFNLMFYRLIGRKETHESLGFLRLADFSSEKLEQSLKQIRNRGVPVFTAAYMVSGYAKYGRDKCVSVSRIFGEIHPMFDDIWAGLSSAKTMEEAYSILLAVPGFGNFLAFQILVDMTYCVPGGPVLDLNQDVWASAGPGAKRGIRLLAGNSKDELTVMSWLHGNQEEEFARLGISFNWLVRDDRRILLSLPDIQNCLCEFHKYVKINEGTGRARRVFRPIRI